MMKDLIYTIPKEKHTKENIKAILKSHSEIKFVSFVGVDLSGNDTDEKIPYYNLWVSDERTRFGNNSRNACAAGYGAGFR